MKKVIFAKSSDIKGHKSNGAEDISGFNNWALRYHDNGDSSVN